MINDFLKWSLIQGIWYIRLQTYIYYKNNVECYREKNGEKMEENRIEICSF